MSLLDDFLNLRRENRHREWNRLIVGDIRRNYTVFMAFVEETPEADPASRGNQFGITLPVLLKIISLPEL